MRNKLIVWVRFPLTEANITKTEPEVELIDTAAGSTWEVKDRAVVETWPPSQRGRWSRQSQDGARWATCTALLAVTTARRCAFLLWGNMPSILHEPHGDAKPRDLLPAGQGGTPSLPCLPWEPYAPRTNAYDDRWIFIGICISNGLFLHLPVITHPLEIIKL